MSVATFQTEVARKESMPDVTSIRIRGRVNRHDGPRLREFLLREIAETPTPKLIFELSGIQEIDTAGAAVLVEALIAAREAGKTVLMCSPSDPVMRMFQLAGFEDVLEHCTANPDDTYRRIMV